MTANLEENNYSLETDGLLRERATLLLNKTALDAVFNLLPQLSLYKRAEVILHIAALDELVSQTITRQDDHKEAEVLELPVQVSDALQDRRVEVSVTSVVSEPDMPPVLQETVTTREKSLLNGIMKKYLDKMTGQDGIADELLLMLNDDKAVVTAILDQSDLNKVRNDEEVEQIAQLLSMRYAGKNNVEIASELGLSSDQVKDMFELLLRRTQGNRILVARGIREGVAAERVAREHPTVEPATHETENLAKEESIDSVTDDPILVKSEEETINHTHEATILPDKALKYLGSLFGESHSTTLTVADKEHIVRSMADLHYRSVRHKTDMVTRPEYELRIGLFLDGLSLTATADVIMQQGLRDNMSVSAIGNFLKKTRESILAKFSEENARYVLETYRNGGDIDLDKLLKGELVVVDRVDAKEPIAEDATPNQEDKEAVPGLSLNELIEATATEFQRASFDRLLTEEKFHEDMYEGREWLADVVRKYAPDAEKARQLLGNSYNKESYKVVLQLAGINTKQNELAKTLPLLVRYSQHKGVNEESVHACVASFLAEAHSDGAYVPKETVVSHETIRRLAVVPELPKREGSELKVGVDLWGATLRNTHLIEADVKRAVQASLDHGKEQKRLSRTDIVFLMGRLFDDNDRALLKDDEKAVLAKLEQDFNDLPQETVIKLSQSEESIAYFRKFIHVSPTFGVRSVARIAEEASRGLDLNQRIRKAPVRNKISGVLQIMYGESRTVS